MMSRDAIVTVAGEELVLLPERAAFWPRTRTLLVADAHIGKAAAFRAAGVLVPRGTTTGTLQRLTAAIARCDPARVMFLGDLLHAREGRAPETLRVVHDWRDRHGTIDMVLVRGNHDARAGDPPASLAIRCIDAPVFESPFALTHRPAGIAGSYVLCGHVHPAARLAGAARDFSRLPCFWFGSSVGVLPAFGEFTGLADVEPAAGDRVWVVVDDAVLEVC